MLLHDSDASLGVAAAAEHVAMTLLNHGGNPWRACDVALVRERIHPATMAAEGPLHELGAIAIVNSDSQGMGRIGEVLRRTLQLAHVMKALARVRGRRRAGRASRRRRDPYDDNARVLRYLAKATIEPAIAHGSRRRGRLARPGRLADIVLWKPAFLGVKPEIVLKAGAHAWGPLGDGNASLERSEPTRYRPDWGGLGPRAADVSLTFVSAAGLDGGLAARLGTRRRLVAVAAAGG